MSNENVNWYRAPEQVGPLDGERLQRILAAAPKAVPLSLGELQSLAAEVVRSREVVPHLVELLREALPFLGYESSAVEDLKSRIRGAIVNPRPLEDYDPRLWWEAYAAICLLCGKRWAAVLSRPAGSEAPEVVRELECPGCHHRLGRGELQGGAA